MESSCVRGYSSPSSISRCNAEFHDTKRRASVRLRMADNSLFAILLRAPWWTSFLVAAGVVASLRLVVPTAYAIFFALPFMVIGGIAGWRQLRAPSAAAVER